MFILWHAIANLHRHSLTTSAQDLWQRQLDSKWCSDFWTEVLASSKDWLEIDQIDANLHQDNFPFIADNPDNRVKIL
jgi:hypothetical protein